MRSLAPSSLAAATRAANPAIATGILVLLLAGVTASRAAAATRQPPGSPDRPAPAGEKPDDDEHEPVKPHGIELRWPSPSATFFARIDPPELPLRLVNRDAVAYAVAVQVLEDAGSLQTRRIGPPAFVTLPPGGTATAAIAFDEAVLLADLTHSGMVVALVTACPAGGGACVNAASDPLFFHRQGREHLVYGERVLCKRFGCGALQSRGKPEPGTWRVLGGGPLHGVAVEEENTPEPERPIDGGVQ